MLPYFLKRIFLLVPTIWGILTINFLVAQVAPGGPVEQMLNRMLLDPQAEVVTLHTDDGYQGKKGLDEDLVKEIEQQFGFDRPPLERYFSMLKNYASFDLGKSFFRDRSVVDLVFEKLPVSISLGLWSTLIVYLISIPLGIAKAVRNGSAFDAWTSAAIVVAYAIPSFLFALLLIVFFAGGSFWQFFPLRGLVSSGFNTMGWGEKILDYFWHLTLPLFSLIIVGLASHTLLTKNAFLEEISTQYTLTARAKGCSQSQVLWKHVFRNAFLVILAGLPSALINMIFAGSLLIEVIFSLDGLGFLGFESAMSRDYPVVFGVLYILSLMGVVAHILGDFLYAWADPRIHYGKNR